MHTSLDYKLLAQVLNRPGCVIGLVRITCPPQLPRVLDDADVAIATINKTFAGAIGLLSTRDGLFVEDTESPYVNAIVVREETRMTTRVKRFVNAYQLSEVEATAKLAFKVSAIKGW